jgi:NitT/TauT family transport system permease protein
VPLVAVAPLLILWLGPGVTTKVVVTALIVFLPMVISTHSGFRTQRQIFLRLMHALHANKWQRFIHLEWPTALPSILSGLKIGAPLSVVGAVVGEFLGADRGLGFLILEANQRLDTPQLFVVILILAALGTLFYTSIHGLEILVLGNRRRSEH